MPHTDENFNNKNTGECMDYTRAPSENKKPGPANFAFLQEMYGTVGGGRRSFLRKLWAKSPVPANYDDVVQIMRQDVLKMEQRTDGQEHLDGWYENHRSEFGSVHTKHFGQGFSVRVTKLLATPDEL